jgi:hypothetical protein
MNRSRGLRGYRSLSSFTPQWRTSERLRKYKKTGCYSGTSVLAGRKHKKTPFSLKRKLSRLHTRYDIPYTHTHNNTGGRDFVFTHPSQDTHKYTWINKSHEPMRFGGWCNAYQEPSPTGVLHTNGPWLRRILLSFQEKGKAGARIEQDRHHKWAQIK